MPFSSQSSLSVLSSAQPLTTLFLDMNSYFASVEQQTQPRWRGRPVAVANVAAETTACVSVSYEAKPYGVRTGTPVWEARRLCPGIVIRVARPNLYVQFHQAIVEAVNTVLPVNGVHSIDEMSCRLLGRERQPSVSAQLAAAIKAAIRERVGAWMHCSVGVAANRLLAKIAADFQKPDGLTVLTSDQLPQRLYRLRLTDLPGIAGGMKRRLAQLGIFTIEQLTSASEEVLRAAWGGSPGSDWWWRLRGFDVPEPPTRRRSLSHSHVLPPAMRTEDAAARLGVRLVHKAGARLRRFGLRANRLTLSLSLRDYQDWSAAVRVWTCRDTMTLMRAFLELWHRPDRPRGLVFKISVTLDELCDQAETATPLLDTLDGFRQAQERLADSMDRVNESFGRDTVYFAGMFGARGAAPTRISFGGIPDDLRDDDDGSASQWEGSVGDWHRGPPSGFSVWPRTRW